ncbi:SCO6745 family protein [Mycolicibacterium sp. CBM1]
MPVLTRDELPVRRFWRAYEPLHAVCYFHPRFAATMAEAGLTGWWNGYFAGRAAALGTTPPQVVTALFFGFAPTMVASAIPKVWTRIAPGDAVQARFAAAETVLAEHTSAGSTDDLRRVIDNLERAIGAIGFDGRALAAAWQSVPRPPTLLGRLWLATTILREHRGDGHVVAATADGLSGLQASITHIATGQVNRDILQPNRGWGDEEWIAARDELVGRGILTAAGSLTKSGALLRDRVEDVTDELAVVALRALPDAEWTVDVLTRVACSIVEGGAVPMPNPIGVPRP